MQHYIVRYSKEDLKTGERFSGVMPIFAASRLEALKRFYASQALDGNIIVKSVTCKKRPAQTFD